MLDEVEIWRKLQEKSVLFGVIRAEDVSYGEYIKAYANRETQSPYSYVAR